MERKYGNIRAEDRVQLEMLEQSRKRQATYVGTPNYMAPEFKEENGEIDERCDIYSFGCVIYELLTGKVLQTEELDREEQAAHISKALEHLSKVDAA
jgi:serine/threonine protein kinase